MERRPPRPPRLARTGRRCSKRHDSAESPPSFRRADRTPLIKRLPGNPTRLRRKSGYWLLFCDFPVPQLAAQHLADEGLWQIRRKLDLFRDFEGCEALFAKCDDVRFARSRSTLEDDERLHALPAVRVWDADRGGFGDGGMREEDLLDLARIDVVPGAEDDVFLPVDDREVAVRVHRREVAGQEPSVPEDCRSLFGSVPIALHHLRTANREFAEPASRDFPRCVVLIDELRVRVGEGDSDAVLHGTG